VFAVRRLRDKEVVGVFAFFVRRFIHVLNFFEWSMVAPKVYNPSPEEVVALGYSIQPGKT
jgi:hypothetical protein